MRSIKILALASLLSLSPLSVAADLSDAEVTKWVTAASALQKWGKQHEQKDFMPNGPEAVALKNPAKAFTHGINEVKKTPHFGEVQGVLKQNGYSDADEWAQLGDRIITAHVANKMAGRKDISPEQLKMASQQMQEMQNNPNLPPALRAQMEQALKGSQAMMESAQDAPAADKAVVLRNASVLEKYFKGE